MPTLPNTTLPNTTVSLSRTAGLNELDGVLWGAGDGYQLRFESWGIEFLPALRSASDASDELHQNDGLVLRLESIGRGAASVALQPSTPRTSPAHALRVEYDRGFATERYDVGVDGVEQSFVFAERPSGDGDLVVRFAMATELTVTPDGDGLRCERAGVGGFHIGGVVGIDARGARVAGTLRVVDHTLELTLPASFVDTAALPFTLDPLVGNVFRLTATTTDIDARVAYDASTDTYFAVWQAAGAVHGHRVSATGIPLGSRLVLASSGVAPDVTNLDATHVFFVVYVIASTAIGGRVVKAIDGSIASGSLSIPGTWGFVTIGGRRGGSPLGPGSALCVWADLVATSVHAAPITVDPNRRPVFTVGTIQTVAPNSRAPSVSCHDAGTGRFAVVYSRVLSGPLQIQARILDSNGQAVTAEQTVAITTGNQTRPSIGGDGEHWVAAWVDGSTRCLARGLRFLPGQGTILPSTPLQDLGSAANSSAPSVTWIGESCLVGFSNGFGFVRSVDLLGCTDCEGLFTTSLDGVSGSGKIESSGPADDALLIGSDGQGIVAQFFHAADGIVTSRGGGCGAGGNAHASCARSPNPTFAHRLVGALPNAPAVFVLASRESPISCGTCSLVPDLGTAIVLTSATSAAGEASVPVPIPANSTLRGVPLIEQWVTIDLSTPACTTFLFDLSDALRVVIE
ncbi:MAG: hypothetical protein U1F36_00045 [Planctomycetota bacterium]